MKIAVNVPEIKSKLIEKLRPAGWAGKLRAFLNSSEFDHILDQLVARRERDERFTPTLKQVFRAFEECPYDELKVVILSQEPYPQLNVADGIGFSCSNSRELQPTLTYLLKEVQKTVYPGEQYDFEPDLKRWSNQGVLLLNAALTTQVGKIGGHHQIWKPFTGYTIDMLNSLNSGLVWVFMGNIAQEWSELVGPSHYTINISHPNSVCYNNKKEWDCEDCFNRINGILSKNYNTEIQW